MALLAFSLTLLASLVLSVGYAFRTPLWQNPDEPAHFNYIRAIALEGALPVLQRGDWDQAYLEQLKGRKFPPELPVEGLRYESHQPPLYYLMGAALYRPLVSARLEVQVRALRLLSVLLGLGALTAAYAAFRGLFPRSAWLPLGAVAFMAALPQRTAMNAAINNDALTELMAALLLWWLLRALRLKAAGPTWRTAALPGILVGLAFLTKVFLYLLLLLIPLALLLRLGSGRALGLSLRIVAIALLVSGWWFLRGVFVYGPLDPLGLLRHDQVVVGQPRLAALDAGAARHFLSTTFRSFWVQLGWMGVPASESAYLLLLLPTAAAAAGFFLFGVRGLRGRGGVTALQRQAFWLLGLWTLVVVLQVVAYNVRYIQPQGRYLYPALAPIALGFLLGWRELLAPRYAALVIAGLLGLLFLFNVAVLFQLVPLLA